jgi:fructose-1,6-bisphosphatase
MTNHERTHAMDLLERKFENDMEAHTLLAIVDAAIRLDQAEVMSHDFCNRLHACVEEHIRLSGDVYDHR